MYYYSKSLSDKTDYAIIVLHGWEGNLKSMEIITKVFDIENIKWFFLQGPYKISTKEFSWFKIDKVTGWKYRASFDLLKKMILDIHKIGFNFSKIFLLGFSQGACLAMEFIIRQKFSMGGIIPIAGFIGLKNQFKTDIANSNTNTPILLIHCDSDDVVLVHESKIAYDLFIDAGFKVAIHILPGRHKIPLKAKNIIERFINRNTD